VARPQILRVKEKLIDIRIGNSVTGRRSVGPSSEIFWLILGVEHRGRYFRRINTGEHHVWAHLAIGLPTSI
jgi:hypothetical protein